jgi:hypothetical protein
MPGNAIACGCGSHVFLGISPCAICTREQNGRAARAAAGSGVSDIERLEAAAYAKVLAVRDENAVFAVSDVNRVAGVSTTPRNGGAGATSSSKNNNDRAFNVYLKHQRTIDDPKWLVGPGRVMCRYHSTHPIGVGLRVAHARDRAALVRDEEVRAQQCVTNMIAVSLVY